MTVKISLGAQDLDAQIQKMEKFNETAEKHYKAAMRLVLAPVKARVKAAAPVMTGKLRKEIWSRVSGIGSNVTGRVALGDTSWYGNVVEFGRYKTRKLPPVGVIAEKYGVPMNQAWLIARAIAASDAKARQPVGFFAKARDDAYNRGLNAISTANEQIVNDLAVNSTVIP